MEITSGIQEGLLSLPKGGGALSSLGERFQPDLLRGSGNYNIPIELPQGPNHLTPNLQLTYSTGQGNSPFGMGWQLSGLLSILRRTDRGLPQYSEQDEFIFSQGDVLVDVGNNRFRPRSDKQHLQIIRHNEGWTVRTKNGYTYYLGSSPDSRLETESQTYGWYLDREVDVAGNEIRYSYLRDENQLYLSRVAWSVYEVQFAYEQRSDIIHFGRAGFPIRTRLRCHTFETRCTKLSQPIITRYALTYEEAHGSGHSLLQQVQLKGLDDLGNIEALPPLQLTYSQFNLEDPEYHQIYGEDTILPDLSRQDTTLIDMDGDGLPDILQANRQGHRYWKNLGDGTFGVANELELQPVGLNLGEPGVSFADLNGNATADIFRATNRLSVSVNNTGEGRWAEDPVIFSQQFPFNIHSAHTRLVDLNGDGVVDLLQSGQNGFTLVYNRGQAGWSDPEVVQRRYDIEQFPDISLNNEDIYLADMTGDGLEDIAFIVSGSVQYWPYYGYGKWGSLVEMRNAPTLPQGFNKRQLFLADLDGDGLTDLLYVDHDRIYYWFNQSGLTWSERFEVSFVPPPYVDAMYMTDLLGTGTRGLLWTTRYPQIGSSSYRFLDLSNRQKPYLLTKIDNGFGLETHIHYSTSSVQRRIDERNGNPWHTFLPFALQVVQEIEEVDRVTEHVSRTKFKYFRGHYDGIEHVFRGFEKVRRIKVGDDHTPTTIEESHFYLGLLPNSSRNEALSPQERAIQHALSGGIQEIKTHYLGENGELIAHRSSVTNWEVREVFNEEGKFVYSPVVSSNTVREHSPNEPDRIEEASYDYDDYGNVTAKRLTTRFDNEPLHDAFYSEQRVTYASNLSAWLVGLPARIETRDKDGQLQSDTFLYYDGPDFTGLPNEEVSNGLLRRSEELVYVKALLPAGFEDEFEASWHLIEKAEGYYRLVEAYRHDNFGNVVALRDPMETELRIEYDADHLFPIRMFDQLDDVSTATFNLRTAKPFELSRENGTQKTRFFYSPLGRLQAKYETGVDGTFILTQFYAVKYPHVVNNRLDPASVINVRPLNQSYSLEELLHQDFDPITANGAGIEVNYYNGFGQLLQQSRLGDQANAPWVIGSRRIHAADGKSAEEYPNEFAASPHYLRDFNLPPVRFFYGPNGETIRTEYPNGEHITFAYHHNRIERWKPGTGANHVPRQ